MNLKSMMTLFGSFLGSKISANDWVEPKKSGPLSLYISVSPWVIVLALMCLDLFHVKFSDATMTPANTANARLCIKMVIRMTMIMTTMSLVGIFPKVLSEDHSKVPMTTMNMTPTSAALGITAMTGDPTMTNSSRKSAAERPESLDRPPELMLIIDWPIIAQPPMPEKKPDTMLPAPSAIHSLFALPLVSVISSIRLSVRRDSTAATPARMHE